VSLVLLGVSGIVQVYADPFSLGGVPPIFNQDPDQALNTTSIPEGEDPIRNGMYWVVNSSDDPENAHVINGVIGADSADKLDDHMSAVGKVMSLIQIVINYTLGLLAFVALVYVMYAGFLMLTAAGDDKKFDKGKKSIKTAVIALAGIGISWLVVSLILRLIGVLTA